MTTTTIPVKARITVTRGWLKGRTGTVYGVVGKRYVVEFDDGRSAYLNAASMKTI
jgi:hypothetical protein